MSCLRNRTLTRDQLRQKRIAVLYGGNSAEREISLRSGKAVYQALLAADYRVELIDVGTNLAEQLKKQGCEIAFIALHGRNGEDGRVQGLLEMLRIPYTGSGVLASSLAMNKILTKQLLLFHGVTTPGYSVIHAPGDVRPFLTERQQFPLVVKPAHEGSTLGISIARNLEELRAGIEAAAGFDAELLVEEFIDGPELTVAVMNGVALPIIQIVPHEGFYDYRAKYTAGQTRYLLPAPLDAALYAAIQQAAVQACQVLGCRGAARVDFMLRDKRFYCLEVNTIPGMTETSLLPKAAAAVGLDFGQLAEQILLDAALDK